MHFEHLNLELMFARLAAAFYRRVRHDEFAVLPELGFNVGWQYNPLWRFYVGYTFLYWSDVARPGDCRNALQW